MAGTPGAGFLQGGVTPEEASLSQYTFGERALRGASRFGSSGMGMSTGETMAGAAGPAAGEAIQSSQLSDALAAASAQFANAQQAAAKGITQQQLGTLGTLLGKGGH